MQHISVIGSGTMGNGIAHVFAQYGYQVNLVDTRQEALDTAMGTISNNLDRLIKKKVITTQNKAETLERIRCFTRIPEAITSADLVVEAASEDLQIKLDIFRQLDQHAPASAILASNTSSISITQIAGVTQRPEKVIGMHFMNPVPVMKLVEVIRAYQTSQATTEEILAVSQSLDKIAVEVHDYPGFIANRILMPMINEAIYALYEGVADKEAIDSVMKLGMAHPMGPLQLADFIGLDVCLSILRVLYAGFGHPKYAPCPLLVNMVAAGKIGKKAKEGFYTYA